MASKVDENCLGLTFYRREEQLPKKAVDSSTKNGTIWSVNSHLEEFELDYKPRNSILELQVYKRRFWIIGVFSFIVFNNFIIWGSWGTIMYSAQYAFGWSDGYIALLGAWGCINSVVFMVPVSLFNEKYGVRKGVLFAITLMTIGTASRCITTNDVAFTYLASFAAICDGIASCITQSLPATISTTWFPPNERTTATAFSIMVGQLSVTVMYLSPLFVRNPPEKMYTTLPPSHEVYSANSTITRDDIKSDIRSLMFIQFGLAFTAFLCVLFYFPDRPLKPPSKSSSEERINFKKSLKLVIRNVDFILMLVSAIIVYDFPIIWFSVMNFSLMCIGIDQDQAMYIAITASIASAVTSLIAARTMDRLQSYMKVTIIGLSVSSGVFFIWFLLMTEKVIVISSNVPVYLAITGGMATSSAAIPIMVELTVELAYPCPESLVGAVLIWSMDFVGNIFLLMMMIPSQCYRWCSYVLAIGVTSTIFPLLAAKVDRRRSAVDDAFLASS